MHFLLINQNPAVSRLITLSVKKLGFKIFETSSFEDFPLESYDMVFVDNELYNEIAIDDMIKSGISRYFVYIASKGEKMPSNMHSVLQKPFLPTCFIDLVAKVELEDSEEDLKNIIDDIEVPSEISVDLEDEDSTVDLDEIEPEIVEEINLEDDLEDDIEPEKNDEPEEIEEPEEKIDDDEPLDFEDELESILDSDDIDEVKQLLEDDNSDELGLEELDDKNDSEDFSLNDLKDKKEEKPEEVAQDEKVKEDFSLDGLEDDTEEELDDIEEEEKIEEEPEVVEDISCDQEENLERVISSLDDLDESVLLEAFGKEALPRDISSEVVDEKVEFKKDIEEKVSQSVREALEESSIKEALKGMRVNVSVTFEEDKK